MEFKSRHAKYLTKNPISKYLVKNFYFQIKSIVKGLHFDSVLDVGCGEGNLLSYLKEVIEEKNCSALDIDENELILAKVNIPFCILSSGSILNLPYPDKSKDLVICTEVLEHIKDYETAINEIFRVASKYVLISVPNEPIWRILNIFRLHYLKDLGNTPGHVNNWSSSSLERLLSEYFNIVQVRKPFPWTLILGEKSSDVKE